MWYSVEDIEKRALEYASRRRSMSIEARLGYGKDGIVYQSSKQTAIKVFARQDMYERELACYRRLARYKVEEVRGHAVPGLLGFSHELLVIEMEIVARPFLLDFADSCLDSAPEFSDEVMESWHEEKRGQFGQRWEEVQHVLAMLRGSYGIHLLDINPGNITFREGPE